MQLLVRKHDSYGVKHNSVIIIFSIIVSIIMTTSIMLNLLPVAADKVSSVFGTSPIAMFIGRILMSLPSKDMSLVACCVAFCLFQLTMHFIEKMKRNGGKKSIDVPLLLLSLLFGFSMTFGNMLEASDMRLSEMLDGVSQAVKILVSMTSWSAIFYMGISLLTTYAIARQKHTHGVKTQQNSSSVLDRILRFSPLIILISWLPILIASFPGIFMGDTPPQIQMFFGMDNWISNTVSLMSPDMLITQHHPVLHTLFIGACMSVGHAISGSYEIGYFIYTLLQFAICVATLSYALSYLKKCNIDSRVRLALLVLIIIFPWFPYTALLGTKDTIFSCIVLLFALRLHAVITTNTMKASDVISLIITGLLDSLLRNGSIVAVLIPIAVIAALAIKKYISTDRKQSARQTRQVAAPIVTIASIVLIYLIVTSAIFPALKFTPGSQREILSIPIQQTAAVVKYHADDITGDERDAIDAVLSYDEMAEKYDDGSSDPVKGTWNKYATKDEVTHFMRTWIGLVMKHPMTCVEATMRNYYGYLYPSSHDLTEYSMSYSDKKIEEKPTLTTELGIGTERSEWRQTLRNILDGFFSASQDMPVMSIIMTSATWVWGLIISMFVTCRMRKKTVLCLIPMLVLFLISLIGPCNASYYFRYLFPVMYTLPFMMPLMLSSQKKIYSLVN